MKLREEKFSYPSEDGSISKRDIVVLDEVDGSFIAGIDLSKLDSKDADELRETVNKLNLLIAKSMKSYRKFSKSKIKNA